MRKNKNYDMRRRLRFNEQVEEQIQIFRLAWVDGRLDALARSLEALKLLLWQWFPEDKQKEYDAITYKKVLIDDLYDEMDRMMIVRCGMIDNRKTRLYSKQVGNINRTSFFSMIGAKFDMFMQVAKMIGLGFEDEVEAHISPDKKKPAFMGIDSFKESMRMSMRKKGTGSAPRSAGSAPASP